MTVLDVITSTDDLTLTLTARYPATVEQVWRLWSDPRLLERWWGPPEFPATVVSQDFRPGGRLSYYMTGPDGAKYPGWWEFVTIDAPMSLSFRDGFANDDGTANDAAPVMLAEVSLEPIGTHSETDPLTHMAIVTTFASLADMEQVTAMGVEEGLRAAVGQIDALLVEVAATR
jgi:uncharacterized protein YndB with AHSA1/START domain